MKNNFEVPKRWTGEQRVVYCGCTLVDNISEKILGSLVNSLIKHPLCIQ